MLANEDVVDKINLLQKIIQTQKLKVKAKNLVSLKKIFMYQAFERVLVKDPVRTVFFLFNPKGNSGRSYDGFQREVFSKYIQVFQENLPITLGNKTYTSLLDEDLELFLGESEFDSMVKNNGVVENNTLEVFPFKGNMIRCFIGHLIDIKIDNVSVFDKVVNYGFAHIKMNAEVAPGSSVKVTHYRIPPHHEQFSLLMFKRIKLKIKESISKYLEKEVQND